MLATCLSLLLSASMGSDSSAPAKAGEMRISYTGEAPEGLVGNGRSVIKTRADGFEFHSGGDAKGRFRLVIDGKVQDLQSTDIRASFYPGCVTYSLGFHGLEVDVLHGATQDVSYVVAFRIRHATGAIALEIESQGQPGLLRTGRIPVPLHNGEGVIVLSTGGLGAVASFEALQQRFEAPYKVGLQLQTPSLAIDRAIPFNRYLLDLGFDGRLHICEIFRWRDVWSRDLGTGLVPGAMVAGRFAAARTTLEYDLRRYARANPKGLKVTEDPSQGGSAEGTAWLTRAVWREYLLNGDKAFLADAAKTLRPWVRAWLDRDPAETGLLVDDSEWMDHSRFFLFPDGARVLYSNALFAELLGTFSRIERTLGDASAAERLQAARTRFLHAINTTLWNEAAGEYDNLSLWGRRDARSCQENALAVLCGVVPSDRVKRVLDTLKANNWRSAGSVTITPPMAHVPPSNDHNYKMWPWWNAVEARARFRHGDPEGGVYLLERCAATLEDKHFPGCIEELTSPEGVTEGGNAFLSAAGSFLDAVYEGLLGVEVVEPGCTRMRVSPNVPKGWKAWQAQVPLPQGDLFLACKDGCLSIRVTDPRVKVIEAPADAHVEGAERTSLSPAYELKPEPWKAPTPLAVPAPRDRKAALFFEEGIPSKSLPGLPRHRVSAEDLAHLDPAKVGALVIAGNALPRKTRDGVDLQAALGRYLDRGGALVFYGATMQDRGTMGETSGVIDWYEYRPVIHFKPILGWKLKASQDAPDVARENEHGFREGWFCPGLPDADWIQAKVPSWWEEQLGSSYDGWGWYRAHFWLAGEDGGKTLVLNGGRIDDDDWTYVNGVLAGATQGCKRLRRYELRPGDAAYTALRFNGDNVIAIQVRDHGGTGGLWEGQPGIGTETGDFAWTPINPIDGVASDQPFRHGVVSWGPGDFFNAWETSRGAFGFKVEGRGAEFAGPLASLSPLKLDVQAAFTDFAVSRPWIFEPLAYTETHRNLLIPDRGERYPCAARVVNRETGGEFILIPEALANSPAGPASLDLLRIK